MNTKKYAIIGPESTGKTTVCKQLSQFYSCPFVPEMSRIYLQTIGTNYSYKDVLEIAILQKETEEKYFENAKNENNAYLFSDTEWICIKIWLDFYQWEVPNWLIKGIENQNYTSYFLMNIDLAWQKDELRQNPNDRLYLYNRFKEELIKFKKKFFEIKGVGNERFEKIIENI